MSSANRGRARNKDDLYETPYWLIEAQVKRIKDLLYHIPKPIIWEPCAGNGRITRVLKFMIPESVVISTDIGEYKGLDQGGVDFLRANQETHGYGNVSMIISNPPFFLAEEIIQHAQTLIHDTGCVVMLERLNFLGTKKREPWLIGDVPHSSISPRRASFLPTRQCDSIEYGWFEWPSERVARRTPRTFGQMRLLNTMACAGCGKGHFDKACPGCDYGYCKTCYKDHTNCEANLFGKDSLWYCYDHPDRPMTHACKAKGCSLPFCDECWESHHPGDDGVPVCQYPMEVENAET